MKHEATNCPIFETMDCLGYDCRYYHPQDKEKCKYSEMKAFRQLAEGKKIKVGK